MKSDQIKYLYAAAAALFTVMAISSAWYDGDLLVTAVWSGLAYVAMRDALRGRR